VAAIERVLTAFERDPDDGLVGEWSLQGIELPELQRLFGVLDDDPMYDCFRVEQKHVGRLQQAVAHQIDLERFEYFVEAYRGEGGDPRCPPRVLPAFPDLRRVKPRTPA
jgi:hypothetical protein